MNLHFRKYGSGPALIILHGLFGSSDNWHSLATKWGQDFEVYALDLRNHGSSPHESMMSYMDIVRDLDQFMRSHNLSSAYILGHSLGGKAAMLFTSIYPEMVAGLVVLDIGVAETIGKHSPLLAVLERVDLDLYTNRASIKNEIEAFISEPAIVQFLLKNIMRRVDSTYAWKFNKDGLLDQYDKLVVELDLSESYMGPVLFVKGANSDYLPPTLGDDVLNYFPGATLETIPEAGHWIHADQPAVVYQLVNEFCRST